jgi:hypothetical protein
MVLVIARPEGLYCPANEWQVEYMWDGIRAQLIKRRQHPPCNRSPFCSSGLAVKPWQKNTQ